MTETHRDSLREFFRMVKEGMPESYWTDRPTLTAAEAHYWLTATDKPGNDESRPEAA